MKQTTFGFEIHWYSRIYNWPKTRSKINKQKKEKKGEEEEEERKKEKEGREGGKEKGKKRKGGQKFAHSINTFS